MNLNRLTEFKALIIINISLYLSLTISSFPYVAPLRLLTCNKSLLTNFVNQWGQLENGMVYLTPLL